MQPWRVFFSRAWGFLHKGRLDEDLREELQAHLDTLTEENIRGGMSPKDARAAALREFGGVEQTKKFIAGSADCRSSTWRCKTCGSHYAA
jgi:hypothetical protein